MACLSPFPPLLFTVMASSVWVFWRFPHDSDEVVTLGMVWERIHGIIDLSVTDRWI